jgi:tetratricopeptide (TPR) repeat protein
LLTDTAGNLPGAWAAWPPDPLAWPQTLAHLARQSLVRIDHRGLQMHRLTQAILRDSLKPEQAAATRARTEAILAASNPGDPTNPGIWPRWAQLMPHVLFADLAATDSPALRLLACDACAYLLARRDHRTCHDLTSDLCRQWRDRLGDDHQHVRAIALYLAWALWGMGRYAEARDLSQETLDRYRRVLGEDHPDTLGTALHLACTLHSLGELRAARDLNQDTLDRYRRVQGEDHTGTLLTAFLLARNLHELGEIRAARDLDHDTLDRYRRVLGDDHPETLRSATNLAADLRALGEVQAARDLDQDILDRQRRVLGEDHPDTSISAANLAADLRAPRQPPAGSIVDEPLPAAGGLACRMLRARLHPVRELLPRRRADDQARAVRVLAVADQHRAGRAGDLGAVAAAGPAVAALPPGAAHGLCRSSAIVWIRSRDAPFGSASPRSASNRCVTWDTVSSFSVTCPSARLSRNTVTVPSPS